MKIRTLMIHQATPPRMDAFLRTMMRNGHRVFTSGEADVWFVDCIWPHKIPRQTIEEMIAYKGEIVLISLGDLNIFKLDGLPDELIDRVSAFAKIQWENDLTSYDLRVTNRMVTFYPFLIGGLPCPSNVESRVCFFGLPTGAEKTEDNLRIRACRILKDQTWFVGGLVGQEGGADPRDISDLETPALPRGDYLRIMSKSLMSLCLPGNSPLTYRMFESLGVGSAVISCCLEDVRWLNRMEPGVHYFSVEPDLSDLLETCEKAVHDNTQAKKIALAGYALHTDYYAIQPDGGLSSNMWIDIKTQFADLGIII